MIEIILSIQAGFEEIILTLLLQFKKNYLIFNFCTQKNL